MIRKKAVLSSPVGLGEKSSTGRKTLIASAFGTILLAGGVIAQEPTPNTFVDVPVPQLTEWNEVNRLTVDGIVGATAKTYIYTDAAAKQAAAADDGVWDVNSPAQVYWELDDGSGRAPGIQVVTDDFDFPTNNCIMASGERDSADFPGTVISKLCSDPPSSSKRYFLEIVEANVPVDLVFDVGLKDIRYGGVKDPADDGGEALEAFREEYGIGRIYRVIQKVINNTDQRLLGIKLELGHGIGDEFVPFNFAEDGVAFELRPIVPREFFEGETGAPDIEVWDETRFATFAPKLFDTGERDRFEEGFFSDQAAGLYPPQSVQGASDKTQFIFSGDNANANGYDGAITQNYFSMVDEQAMGSTLPQGLFGYWLSDSLAPFVIGRYDDGDPEGESDAVEAWWDGFAWRYGLAGNPGTGALPFSTVPDTLLEQWATKLLGIDPDQLDDSVRYASIVSDDLANLNMDAYIYIGEGILDAEGNPKYDSITYRVTAIPTTDSQSLGNDTPDWIDGDGNNNAPSLATYLITDAPVALNDLVTTYELVTDPGNANFNADEYPLGIPVLDNDVFNGELLTSDDVTVSVDSVQLIDGVSADVGTAEVNNSGVLPTIDFTPVEGFTGLATFTYTVTVTGTGTAGDITAVESNEATVAIRVNAYPDPDAPIAANDSAVTFKDSPVTIDVLANDTLPDGEPTTAILDEPLTGSAMVADGEVVYTPATGFLGLDRFTYTVTVNGEISNAALITVRVDEPIVDDEPPAVDEPASSNGGGGGGGGCSYNPSAPFDPTLVLLFLLALGGIAARRRVSQQQQ